MSDYQKVQSAFRNHRGGYQSERWMRAADRYNEANTAVNRKIGHKGRSTDDLSDHARNLLHAKINSRHSTKDDVITTAGAGASGAAIASLFTKKHKVIGAVGGLTAGATGIGHVVSRLRSKNKLAEAQRVHDAFKRETGL